jgi:hypothetical protein
MDRADADPEPRRGGVAADRLGSRERRIDSLDPKPFAKLAYRTMVQALPSTGCTAFGSTSLPVEAAIKAADQSAKADDEIRQALCRKLAEARYEAS